MGKTYHGEVFSNASLSTMCRVCIEKRGVSRVVRWGLSMRIILVFTMLSNLFIVDEDLVRTRPTGGYRREYGT